MSLSLNDIKEAKKRLDGIVRTTSIDLSNLLSEETNAKVYLKCENQQKTGSFKIRGSYNKIAKLKDKLNKNDRIIAASAGNHAQGVAYAASQCGFKSTVVMPKFAPLAKIEATRAYGAHVELVGNNFDESFSYAQTLDGVFIHPYDDADVIAGQGTIGLEILDQVPDVDMILVPAGGGGLLAGIACAVKEIKPDVEIIGIQAENANAIEQSFKSKKIINTTCSNTIADGIAVRNPGKLTTEIINRYVDNVISVSDHDIASAVLTLLERGKHIVEPAGAASVAALSNTEIAFAHKNVVCLLSGGNIDVNTISNIIERGLTARSRHVELVIKAPDHYDSTKEIFNIIIDNGANILSFLTDKSAPDCNVGYEKLYIVCEFNGVQHRRLVEDKLRQQGFQLS